MKVDVFVFGDYKGCVEAAENSLIGLLARKRYDKLPERIKEFKYDLIVFPVDLEKKDGEKETKQERGRAF